ncbi:hypothetical protein QG37_01743 [Candidozyma auris]|nr:hypothetical protein QG37_01743 [[Candida] auris]
MSQNSGVWFVSLTLLFGEGFKSTILSAKWKTQKEEKIQ